LTLEEQLGPESVPFTRAEASLSAIWQRVKVKPSVALKRRLWTQLLRLVYGRDIEDDALWLQHTYLVVVAKAIAARVLGFEVDKPDELLSGRRFTALGVLGAVEGDFFDWVLEDNAGNDLVVRLARHVARFRLHDVEIDVLKLLYEALIDRDQRHGLGEYYTPDWLAAKVVRAAVDKPLEQRVLDPGCGSGTFLFHAVRRYLEAARKEGIDPQLHAERACELVAGMDIHPVAAIIARVTYLLALGDALNARRGDISIPVYLGDAMQLSVSGMLADRELVIQVPAPDKGNGEREMLRFPEAVCRDPHLLDSVVDRMRLDSENKRRPEAFRAAVKALGVTEAELDELVDTYRRYDELRRADRKHHLVLRRPQSLAPALSGCRRASRGCSRGKSAVARASPHVGRPAHAVQGPREGREHLCGWQARDAERSVRAVLRARGRPLSQAWRTRRVRDASRGNDARAVREIPLRELLQ
jgi:SAM-dependent methyltransferase